MELPLLAEAGELQQEAHRVIGLVQTGQALHGAHCVQTLGGGGAVVNKEHNSSSMYSIQQNGELRLQKCRAAVFLSVFKCLLYSAPLI